MSGAATETQPPPSLPYLPGLDLLRGIAILMVLLFHGLGIFGFLFDGFHNRPMHWLGEILYQSYHGVHLFFVLSGFLITGILLDSRTDRDYFRNFYTRRVLRIAPAYLLMLTVLLALHAITWRYVAVCLFCLCNMTGLLGATPQYGPLWSLSVEEQFYLLWPMAVRHAPAKRLAQLCTAIILLTPALRLALLYGPVALRDIEFKTWVLADFFAAGALLAIAVREPRWHSRLRSIAVALLLISAALFVVLQGAPHLLSLDKLYLALDLEPWLLVFTGLTACACLRLPSVISRIGRSLIFLAKISYSLYLCHQLLFDLVDRYWPLPPGTPHLLGALTLRFLAESALSIAVATLSRYTLEAFFLGMKPKYAATMQAVEVAPYNGASRGK